MEQVQEGWSRTCPQCSQPTVHKTKAKCRDAENHDRPCIKCSRKNVGKANALTDACPVCNETVRITAHDPIDLKEHAASHSLTPQQLWHLKHADHPNPNLCACGCGKETTWVGWWKGYSRFLDGHNASIYCGAYTPEEAAKIANTRGSNWRGKPGIWKGRKKETDQGAKRRGERAGVERRRAIAQGRITFDHLRFSKEEIELMLKDNRSLVFERLENYTNSNVESVWVRCKNCDFFEKVKLGFAKNDRCPKCNPLGSHGQHQVADFIESLGLTVGRNVKGIAGKRQELDVFVPEKLLAVEFNGLYWHSEAAGRDRYYHSDKSEACSRVGVRLIQVFEDEWVHRCPVVEGLLKRSLGVIRGTPVDSCRYFVPSQDDARDFVSTHSLEPVVGPENVGFTSPDARQVLHVVSARLDGDVVEVLSSTGVSWATVDGALERACTLLSKKLGCVRFRTTVGARYGERRRLEAGGWTLAQANAEQCWFTDGLTRSTRGDVFPKGSDVSPIWGPRSLTFVRRFVSA